MAKEGDSSVPVGLGGTLISLSVEKRNGCGQKPVP